MAALPFSDGEAFERFAKPPLTTLFVVLLTMSVVGLFAARDQIEKPLLLRFCPGPVHRFGKPVWVRV
jgi:hypothetical protein